MSIRLGKLANFKIILIMNWMNKVGIQNRQIKFKTFMIQQQKRLVTAPWNND